jgi:hypothetical protein
MGAIAKNTCCDTNYILVEKKMNGYAYLMHNYETRFQMSVGGHVDVIIHQCRRRPDRYLMKIDTLFVR